MADTNQRITASLEAIASDLNALVIERYFALCPASEQVMRYMDEYMRGRMLEQVYLLMLGAEDFEAWLDFELANHREYGVEDDMYRHLFDALHQVVREHVGETWRQEWEEAWQRRKAELLTFIGAHAAPPRHAAAGSERP